MFVTSNQFLDSLFVFLYYIYYLDIHTAGLMPQIVSNYDVNQKFGIYFMQLAWQSLGFSQNRMEANL